MTSTQCLTYFLFHLRYSYCLIPPTLRSTGYLTLFFPQRRANANAVLRFSLTPYMYVYFFCMYWFGNTRFVNRKTICLSLLKNQQSPSLQEQRLIDWRRNQKLQTVSKELMRSAFKHKCAKLLNYIMKTIGSIPEMTQLDKLSSNCNWTDAEGLRCKHCLYTEWNA